MRSHERIDDFAPLAGGEQENKARNQRKQRGAGGVKNEKQGPEQPGKQPKRQSRPRR